MRTEGFQSITIVPNLPTEVSCEPQLATYSSAGFAEKASCIRAFDTMDKSAFLYAIANQTNGVDKFCSLPALASGNIDLDLKTGTVKIDQVFTKPIMRGFVMKPDLPLVAFKTHDYAVNQPWRIQRGEKGLNDRGDGIEVWYPAYDRFQNSHWKSASTHSTHLAKEEFVQPADIEQFAHLVKGEVIEISEYERKILKVLV